MSLRERITCADCRVPFFRPHTHGPKPKRCLGCARARWLWQVRKNSRRHYAARKAAKHLASA